MNTPESNGVKLAELKGKFKAWKVPTQADFEALIALATLNYRPGEGLDGGDKTGGDAGRVDPDKTKEAWHVLARDNSLTATAAGVALSVVPATSGLTLESGKLSRHNKPDDGSLTANTDALGVVKGDDALDVQATVSLRLADESGLTFTADHRLRLNVDDNTVKTDGGTVQVNCSVGGGLKIGPTGGLMIDIETILKQ